ncbi:TetR/AcrR family transcriptional regulator [Nocardia amikacinitolerans]|uniref:TetR/AcrR family transcriptional regulator n=1 Tax=Nocardia amikacinitolerans TaxID=756689 RepID=UPI0008327ED9|nr:TetR/AcrR family transcriptional regulator [Nocardia amikacinitolerans]
MSKQARAYGGVPADQRRAARREQLLEAAFEVMALDGPAGLTIRNVAKAAGLSTRFVYESFTDLDELAGAAFELAVRQFSGSVAEAVAAAESDRRAKVTATIEAMVDFFLATPAKGKLLSTKAYGLPAVAERRLARSEDITKAFGAILGELAPDAPDNAVELTARFLVGGFGDTITAWIQQSLPYPRDEFVHDNVELFLATIAAMEKL